MCKLLYIATNLNASGGVSRVLSVKLNYLAEQYGYKIHIINTTGNSNSFFYHFDERIQIHSLNQNEFKLFDILEYKNKIQELIQKINPHIIINCDNGLKGVLLPFLLRSKVPLIYENHYGINPKAETLIGKLKIKLFLLLFSLSTYRYKWIIVLQNVRRIRFAENIKIIPNPLSFKIMLEEINFEKNVVIAVGRFSYQKGYDKLLKIWALVIEKHPEQILNIYGEGSKNDFNKLAQKLNIIQNVKFFEPVKDIKSVYFNASMLLNTSRFEPFGIALIEAMACGLPVIAFNNTLGPSSYIVNNENGFLIEKDDFNAYANMIVKLIENKNEMKRISNKARASMKDYELHTIMKQWHDLFQSIH